MQFDLITIIISGIVVTAVCIGGVAIHIIKGEQKKEKNLRAQLKADSQERTKSVWNDLINSNEGYVESTDEGFQKYVVPIEITQRQIISVSLDKDESHFWTIKDNDITKETFKNDDIIIEHQVDGEKSYAITETVRRFNEKDSSIEKSERTKIFLDDELLNNGRAEVENANNNVDDDEPEEIAEPSCDEKPYDFPIQLICVSDNKISILWFKDRDKAETQMKKMLNFIGGTDIDFGESVNNKNVRCCLKHNNAYLRRYNHKYDWMVVDLIQRI